MSSNERACAECGFLPRLCVCIPSRIDIARLQAQINSLSLVVEGLEYRIAELDGGYSSLKSQEKP